MKIILYGAGRRGRSCYEFLKMNGFEKIVYGFCDKMAHEIKMVEDKKVWLIEELEAELDNIVFCLTLTNAGEKEKIRIELGEKRCIEFEELSELILHVDKVKFNRDFCAYIHNEKMDSYFANAESKESLDIFWSEDSDFYKMFKKLDTTNIVELACGRGRHVPNYFNDAGMITLVDILQKNIDICKERFGNTEKIKYYKNDGYNLRELKSDTYTSLFTYDAMVHFELIDIYEYLKDIYRILAGGGRALFHHSNNHAEYKASFSNTFSGRSFMSKECFAYLADRAGFNILEQKIIDWSEPNLDCITLVEKPKNFIEG